MGEHLDLNCRLDQGRTVMRPSAIAEAHVDDHGAIAGRWVIPNPGQRIDEPGVLADLLCADALDHQQARRWGDAGVDAVATAVAGRVTVPGRDPRDMGA